MAHPFNMPASPMMLHGFGAAYMPGTPMPGGPNENPHFSTTSELHPHYQGKGGSGSSGGGRGAGLRRKRAGQRRPPLAGGVAPAAAHASGAEELPNLHPLWKTRLCNFHMSGACQNASGCPFAHGVEDLRPSPDFERTSMCPTFLNQGVCDKPNCRYAHSAEELRSAPGLLKTKMCSFYLKGLCVVGEACRFAHNVEELQEAIAVQKIVQGETKPKPSQSLWEQRRLKFGVSVPTTDSSEMEVPMLALPSSPENESSTEANQTLELVSKEGDHPASRRPPSVSEGLQASSVEMRAIQVVPLPAPAQLVATDASKTAHKRILILSVDDDAPLPATASEPEPHETSEAVPLEAVLPAAPVQEPTSMQQPSNIGASQAIMSATRILVDIEDEGVTADCKGCGKQPVATSLPEAGALMPRRKPLVNKPARTTSRGSTRGRITSAMQIRACEGHLPLLSKNASNVLQNAAARGKALASKEIKDAILLRSRRGIGERKSSPAGRPNCTDASRTTGPIGDRLQVGTDSALRQDSAVLSVGPTRVVAESNSRPPTVQRPCDMSDQDDHEPSELPCRACRLSQAPCSSSSFDFRDHPKECAMCPRYKRGAHAGSSAMEPCAACNCGVKVVARNTFLTVDHDEVVAVRKAASLNRSKSF